MKYIQETDPKIASLISQEKKRQEETLMMIASENHASKAVEEAVGSVLGNKYAEGYPNKRYYQGQKFVDQVELLAIERAQELFGAAHVNVQAYSGSPANAAVYFGLLKPGAKIMGLTLSHGGHLTHGHPKVTFSGKYFESIPYEVNKDGWIDYEALAKFAKKHKPDLIVAGTTAYPRQLEFDKFAEIADSVGALLLADISHISGLVATGVHPDPMPHAHVVMTTTHKTLRAARGALIMVSEKGLKRDPKMGRKIDSAVFPGLQGGPHLNNIAGIAVGLQEALQPTFKTYAQQIVKNAKALAQTLSNEGFDIVTGGTDNHLMVVDLRPIKMLGKDAAILLEKAGIVLNYNTVPFDPNPPFNPSGLRIGTPAITSRGMTEKEMKLIGKLISDVLTNKITTTQAHETILKICQQFPVKETYS